MTTRLIASGLLAAGLLGPLAALPGHAQDAGQPGAQPLQQGVEVRLRSGPAGTAVDEGALRYYASRGERAMVEAEIARLRQLHPGWEPPADLFRQGPAVDEQRLWALYEQKDYAAVRAEIARIERENPDWHAPDLLVELMEENEVRAQLTALEEQEAWARLVEVAQAHPQQLTCGRIDNLWRLARAYHGLGRKDDAFATYAGIVERCDDLDHRIATLQKAKGHISGKQLERLFALEGQRDKTPAEAKRIAALRAAPADAPPTAIARLFQPDAGVAQAETAAGLVLRRKDAAAAERLGWIYYEAGRFEDAQAWFERAHGWAPTVKRAEGLARAHARLGHDREVTVLAAAYPRELGPLAADARRERLGRAFEANEHRTVLEASVDLDQPLAHNLRGWTFLRLERPSEAMLAFERVLDADDVPGDARREAAYGIAMARLALGNLDQALAMADAYHLPFERRRELHAEVLDRKAARAFAARDFQTSVALLEERRNYVEPTREILLQEAWARYQLGQRLNAQRIFAQLDRIYGTPETAEGLRVTGGAIDRFGS